MAKTAPPAQDSAPGDPPREASEQGPAAQATTEAPAEQATTEGPSQATAAEDPSPQGPDYRSAPRLLRRFLGGRRAAMAAAIVCGVIAGACEVLPAWAVWRLVSAIVAGDAGLADVASAASIALAGVVGKAVFFAASTALAHLVAFGVIADIRMELGRVWVGAPVGALARMHSARAKTVALDHCEKLELFIAHAVPETAAALTVWSAVTVWLFAVDWRLALATVALVPLAFATMLHAMRSNGHRMGEWVAANGRMSAAILDFVTAMPVIRVFNRTGEDHRRTTDAVRRNAELQSAWGKAFVTWGAPFSTLVASGVAVIAPVAAWLLARGAVEPAVVLLFLILGPTYPVPLVTMFYRMVALPLLSTGAAEIESHLASEFPRRDAALADGGATGSRETNSRSGGAAGDAAGSREMDLRFEDVTFSHEPGSPVLHDVSFTVAPGTVTALVGVSGSGKSTIGELALGFHRPDSGRVLIGGRDIAGLSDADLYPLVSAVFQKPYLLAGTIRDNVVLGRPDASDDELGVALDAAAVTGFAGELDDGLGTSLGEGGSGLSGGERQRVSIARALLADRPVLILDEATAATDPDNEALIQQGLARVTEGRTVLVIAHRLHTIRRADQILVLSGGRIVERGTHADLLAADGVYARLWTRQEETMTPIRDGGDR